MDLHLAAKPVIVTGGGAGIGAAICLLLAHERAIPVLFERNPLGAAFEAKLRAAQPRSLYFQLDVRDDDACAKAVSSTVRALGGIHGLVNNAGANDHIGLDAGAEAFSTSLQLNLVSTYRMAHLCLPHLRTSRGAIVNIASKTAVTGQGGTSAYVAAKAGLLGLTREWALELARDGIRVNCVIPAEVMTPMYASELARTPDPAAAKARIERHIPLGQRMTSADEIARAVVFHLSDAAGHTTGQWLFVDGGYTHLDRMAGAQLAPASGQSSIGDLLAIDGIEGVPMPDDITRFNIRLKPAEFD